MSIDLKSISERNREDLCTGESLGIAATRYDDRKLAVKGQLEKNPVEFEPSEGVEFGGALFFTAFPFVNRLIKLSKALQSFIRLLRFRCHYIDLGFFLIEQDKKP